MNSINQKYKKESLNLDIETTPKKLLSNNKMNSPTLCQSTFTSDTSLLNINATGKSNLILVNKNKNISKTPSRLSSDKNWKINFNSGDSNKKIRSMKFDLGDRSMSPVSTPQSSTNVTYNNLTPNRVKPVYSSINVFAEIITSNVNNSNIINHTLQLSNLSVELPLFESSKRSAKSLPLIRGYGVNTHRGTTRNYNEDRVSIIVNITKPTSFKGSNWPSCSFFGIYDGHGGNGCADFLKDNLHHLIISDSNFPSNPVDAIRKGCERAEYLFTTKIAIKNSEIVDKSGSCALICIIIEDIIYMVNVGDSRAILSKNNGKTTICLTRDHKPSDEIEKKRIIDSGGRVYQTNPLNLVKMNVSLSPHNSSFLMGPHRVFPGRLSVSRTFGDIQHKHSQFGGLNNVIISTPEISFFRINESLDFMFLGCDGIYDVLTNEEIVQAIWMTTLPSHRCDNIHNQTALGVDMIIKTCLIRKALDNISCVLISFSNFEKHINDNMNISINSEMPGSNKMLNEFKSNNIQQNYSKSNKNVVMDLKFNNIKAGKNPENKEGDFEEDDGNCLRKCSKEETELDAKETENEEEDYKIYKRQNLEFHSGVGNIEAGKSNNKTHNIITTIMDIERWDSEIKESLSPEINYKNFSTKHKEKNDQNLDN